MKHLLKLFTAFFISFTVLPISNTFSDIIDDSNLTLARETLLKIPQMTDHFMNMNIEEYAACAASVIIIVAAETNNTVVLNDEDQLYWGVIMAGTGLARQNLILMGHSDDLLQASISNKVSLSNDPSTPLIALTECASYMEKV
jgi:hypothetical protein